MDTRSNIITHHIFSCFTDGRHCASATATHADDKLIKNKIGQVSGHECDIEGPEALLPSCRHIYLRPLLRGLNGLIEKERHLECMWSYRLHLRLKVTLLPVILQCFGKCIALPKYLIPNRPS